MNVKQFIHHHDNVCIFRADCVASPMFRIVEYLQDKGLDCRRRMGTQTNNIFYIFVDNKKRYMLSLRHHWRRKYSITLRSEVLRRLMYKRAFDLKEIKEVNEKLLFTINNFIEDEI